MMNLIVEKGNRKYDLEKLNIFTRDFVVSSPEYDHTFEKIDGMDGMIDLGTTINATDLYGVFYFESDSIDNYADKRDEVFSIFESTESFYVTDSRQPFQRWLVKIEGVFDIEQVLKYGLFEIDFTAIKGRAESIGTTTMARTFEHLDLPVTYTDYEDIYATRFNVYNAGETIDPRSIHNLLKITYKGNSENLRIENKTTGDVWQYLGTSNSSDTIVLEGIRSTKNGLSILRQTNKRLITLAPGWNEFEISGAPDAQRHAVQANMPRKKIPNELKPNPITFEFKYRF